MLSQAPWVGFYTRTWVLHQDWEVQHRRQSADMEVVKGIFKSIYHLLRASPGADLPPAQIRRVHMPALPGGFWLPVQPMVLSTEYSSHPLPITNLSAALGIAPVAEMPPQESFMAFHTPRVAAP